MVEQTQQRLIIDPDCVPETLCDGQFNIFVAGPLATLTFTQMRPEAAGLLKDGTIDLKAVVRARVVLTTNNLVALRDLLSQVIQRPGARVPPAGDTRH